MGPAALRLCKVKDRPDLRSPTEIRISPYQNFSGLETLSSCIVIQGLTLRQKAVRESYLDSFEVDGLLDSFNSQSDHHGGAE